MQSLVFFAGICYNKGKIGGPGRERERFQTFSAVPRRSVRESGCSVGRPVRAAEESVFGSEEVLSREKAKLLSPVVLAFVGDAAYSLYVRERLVRSGGGRASDFQRAAARVVSAHGQSEFLERLLPCFTEEEAEIFRRGRNAKKATKSKNASVSDYNRSTGFEAVLGFLYLTGSYGRIGELLALDGEDSYKIDAVCEGYKPGR